MKRHRTPLAPLFQEWSTMNVIHRLRSSCLLLTLIQHIFQSCQHDLKCERNTELLDWNDIYINQNQLSTATILIVIWPISVVCRPGIFLEHFPFIISSLVGQYTGLVEQAPRLWQVHSWTAAPVGGCDCAAFSHSNSCGVKWKVSSKCRWTLQQMVEVILLHSKWFLFIDPSTWLQIPYPICQRPCMLCTLLTTYIRFWHFFENDKTVIKQHWRKTQIVSTVLTICVFLQCCWLVLISTVLIRVKQLLLWAHLRGSHYGFRLYPEIPHPQMFFWGKPCIVMQLAKFNLYWHVLFIF
jgi:hypothetical protein